MGCMREADERELKEPPFEIVNGRKVYDMSFIVNSEFRSALPSLGRLEMAGAGPPDTPLLTLASSRKGGGAKGAETAQTRELATIEPDILESRRLNRKRQGTK